MKYALVTLGVTLLVASGAAALATAQIRRHKLGRIYVAFLGLSIALCMLQLASGFLEHHVWVNAYKFVFDCLAISLVLAIATGLVALVGVRTVNVVVSFITLIVSAGILLGEFLGR
jgi:cytochrome bd-type quinol oxidase subunit 1